jgi:prolyl-tRNA synthetase
VATVAKQLAEIQQNLYTRALAFRKENTREIDSKDEFYAFFTPKNDEKPEIHGGFALTHFAGDAAVEAKIKEDLNVTVRSIPFDSEHKSGTCIFTGSPSTKRLVFAKSY